METVTEVVAALDTDLNDIGTSFAKGEYSLWLGAAISRDVVPDLAVLLERVLELLRAQIDPAVPDCRFKAALYEVLDVAGVDSAVRNGLNLAAAVSSWPHKDAIVNGLIYNYSAVLDSPPAGERADYLVWTGLDVPNTYGDPGLAPDAEHLSVAILILEGVARRTQTTNWDGLIEAALARLTPNSEGVLRVVVAPEDFRGPERRNELLKFHGCAVRARADETTYRELLVARMSQIAGWTEDTDNHLMKEHLQHVFTTRPALIVGLSAQDANINTVFSKAIQNLRRDWPASPPAVVVANKRLSSHHKNVLRLTYGAETYAEHSPDIDKATLLNAYAKPALAGLVLYVLAHKLGTLLRLVPGLALSVSEVDSLEADLLALRNKTATAVGTDERKLIDIVINAVTIASLIFRKGAIPAAGPAPYIPISTVPIEEAAQDADFPADALGRFALTLALLSRAHDKLGWILHPGTPTDPDNGVINVQTSNGESKVFVVQDTREAINLELANYNDGHPESMVIIQANSGAPTMTRSPRGRYGRTGRVSTRRLNMEDLIAAASGADELFESFALQGAF